MINQLLTRLCITLLAYRQTREDLLSYEVSEKTANIEIVNFHQPNYLILASKIVRPSSVYNVVVHVLSPNKKFFVTAAILRDLTEISHGQGDAEFASPAMLSLWIPANALPGSYILRIEGNLSEERAAIHFLNETSLQFSSRTLAILIQMNRPMYNFLQKVRFRVILLTASLKPYNDPVTVHLLDPSDLIIRRWISLPTNHGVLDISFDLPENPRNGWWKINVTVFCQAQSKRFLVVTYYGQKFEIFFKMKPYIIQDDTFVNGSLNCYFSNEKGVQGNATIRFSVKSATGSNFVTIKKEVVSKFDSTYDYHISLEDVRKIVVNLENAELKVEATVKEIIMGIETKSFVISKIIKKKLQLNFLSSNPVVFKPGMPFENRVYASYTDGHFLEKSELSNSFVDISVTTRGSGAVKNPNFRLKLDSKGMAQFKIEEVPIGIEQLNIRAAYVERDANRSAATSVLKAYAFYSPSLHYLQVESSTKEGTIGEYAVFHVLAKDKLIYADELMIKDFYSTVITFTVPVSPEMAPSFKIVVYKVNHHGELIMDSLTLPAKAVNRRKISLNLSQFKDHSMKTVQYDCRSIPGSYFGISGLRSEALKVEGSNELTKFMIISALNSFENYKRSIHKIRGQTSDSGTRQEFYYQASNYGIDTVHTLQTIGMIVLTDASIQAIPKASGDFLESDTNDEEFRLTRFRPFSDFFDNSDDWLWLSLNIDADGKQIESIKIPKVQDEWSINAFSIDNKFGISIIENFIKRPFVMNVEAPGSVRAGEQFGIRLILFNNMNKDMLVLIKLENSEDYKFVHVESDGVVNHYNPRTSHGEHQHLIFLDAETAQEVHVPIVPVIASGELKIVIEAFTQIGEDREEIIVAVKPEGVSISKHITTILDLKNRANVYKFLDIEINDSPIVPYSHWRRYIFGTPSASVSVSGDIVGGLFPEIPLNKYYIFGSRTISIEEAVFDFSINLWWLKYMRLTHQWENSISNEVFKAINVAYSQITAFYKGEGFCNWDGDADSVWLTGWVLRQFVIATFQEWENFIYIDPRIFQHGVSWLLGFQQHDGAFIESKFTHPLTLSMLSDSQWKKNQTKRHIPLTAHITVALHLTIPYLVGDIQNNASNAKRRAINYLEQQLRSFNDPYEIAVAAYALILTQSPDSDRAFSLLDKNKRVQEGKFYWSPTEMSPSNIRFENSRPFLMSRSENENDALAFEATCYALLVYIMREGIGIIEEQIMLWINSNKMNRDGFISTVDTIICLQALVEYSSKARLRDVTDIKVIIEPSTAIQDISTVRISNKTMANLQKIDILKPWGHINIIAQGSGQALLNLDSSFGIDYEALKDNPPIESYELKVTEFYHHWRNKSFVTIECCTRWIDLKKYKYSGASLLTVEIPSGYVIRQDEADEVVSSNEHPNLRGSSVGDFDVTWSFNRLGNEMKCFNFTVIRWYPVANLTQYRKAILKDSFQPERFVVAMTRSTSLHLLNICEVCGSYQCPYCPHFSRMSKSSPNTFCVYSTTILAVNYFLIQKGQ